MKAELTGSPSASLLLLTEHENAIYFRRGPHRLGGRANLSGRSRLLFSSLSSSKRLTAAAASVVGADRRLIRDEQPFMAIKVFAHPAVMTTDTMLQY